VFIIGIDPHKASHTAVVIDGDERLVGELSVRADRRQRERLLGWAAAFEPRLWAVEGATGTGALLAQQLVGADETVLDVPPALSARARLLDSGHKDKTDPCDALCAVLCEMSEGGLSRNLSAKRAASELRKLRPQDAIGIERKRIACEFLDEVRRHDQALIELRHRIDTAVGAAETTVTDVHGVGPIVAAYLIGYTGNIARFPSTGHYARYNATAPKGRSGPATRRPRPTARCPPSRGRTRSSRRRSATSAACASPRSCPSRSPCRPTRW
jgi:transposase